jgi:ADP-ribosyl-[dinitrogen reductase] hydrolase
VTFRNGMGANMCDGLSILRMERSSRMLLRLLLLLSVAERMNVFDKHSDRFLRRIFYRSPQSMLIELAVGDAYGAGFEYAALHFVRNGNDLSCYRQHPKHRIKPGCYTDDTQMSLAVAEMLVSGDEWTPLNLANQFVECFKRDPREGYARGFYDFLCSVQNGEEFLDRIQPRSDKSGAAMRAVPIGVCNTIAEVVRKATIQARLTHDTVDGVNAAIAAALMSHYLLYELGPKNQLGEFLMKHVDGQWNVKWHGEVGPKGWMSVRAAITAVQENDSLSEILRAAIGFTGDVDTVATIALGSASCSAEVVDDLPRHLLDDLENGNFGRDYLMALDKSLLGKN